MSAESQSKALRELKEHIVNLLEEIDAVTASGCRHEGVMDRADEVREAARAN